MEGAEKDNSEPNTGNSERSGEATGQAAQDCWSAGRSGLNNNNGIRHHEHDVIVIPPIFTPPVSSIQAQGEVRPSMVIPRK